ncbi:MAG: DUF2235 domain-containing protein [Rhodobacteraceae bacterium]|nr:DUF2235 domain-containing protein [Paracoccaceae bacterium]
MKSRPQHKHIIVIDGTKSNLREGTETNAGLLYRLLQEATSRDNTTLWYNAGIQGHGLWNWVTIASGWGINDMIKGAYTQLCRNYQPGDLIYLFGFSRGAYAARSVAGMIYRLGLVRQSSARRRKINMAFHLYETDISGPPLETFRDLHCHRHVGIEMIGVWDTVKALGLPYPLLTHLAPMATEFHDDQVSEPVKNAFQALAIDEDRTAFCPVLWDTEPGWKGHLEQAWFSGAHADIGGQVNTRNSARGLSNIPLVWMLERVEICGIPLPQGWRDRFPCDPNAAAIGNRSGIARFFLLRKSRVIGDKPGEYIHGSVTRRNLSAPISPQVQQTQ